MATWLPMVSHKYQTKIHQCSLKRNLRQVSNLQNTRNYFSMTCKMIQTLKPYLVITQLEKKYTNFWFEQAIIQSKTLLSLLHPSPSPIQWKKKKLQSTKRKKFLKGSHSIFYRHADKYGREKAEDMNQLDQWT